MDLLAIAIYRIRFGNMFAGIFIISAFIWFPLELQANEEVAFCLIAPENALYYSLASDQDVCPLMEFAAKTETEPCSAK